MTRRIFIVLALLLVVGTAGLTTVGLTTRARGQRALRAVLDRHEAEGRGSSFADLAALAPPVDRERQARLRAWMKRSVFLRGWRVERDLAWRLGPSTPPPAEVVASHEAFRADAGALETLFAEGDLCLTSLGWMPDDPGAASLAERLASPIPNLLRVRSAYAWFATEAALAEDPARALSMLDRLGESLARPGCLIDAMITIAGDAMRDEALLVLALAGRLSPARIDAWTEEPPRAREILADGLRGERLRFLAPLGRELLAGASLADLLGPLSNLEEGNLWTHRLRPWVHGARECAACVDALLAVEQHLRGEIDREAMDARVAPALDVGYPFALVLPNTRGMVRMGEANAGRHRLVRAAFRLARASADRGALPADALEARAWRREERPTRSDEDDAPRLRYVRLSADRFRVAFDTPDGGVPVGWEDPPSERPLVLHESCIEVRVDVP